MSYSESATPAALAKPLSIRDLSQYIEQAFLQHFPLPFQIIGEVSSYTQASSGHRYFSLKEGQYVVRAALFRHVAQQIPHHVLAQLREGQQVIVKAKLTNYAQQGQYQLIIYDVALAGLGDAAEALQWLKQKLEKQGYFDDSSKRPIPSFPKKIAIVTSPTGAAIRDVMITLKKRAPFIPTTLYPCLVQGADAPLSIVSAMQNANADVENTVILLVRGGGSQEDLAAFNDERVADAIFQSRLPVIAGVGHETDTSIADWVADARAATPTAAAVLASPDAAHLQQQLNTQRNRLCLLLQAQLRQKSNQQQHLMHRLQLQHPLSRINRHNQQLDEGVLRLKRVMQQRIEARKNRLQHLQARLRSVAPHRQLQKQRQQLSQQVHRLKIAMHNRLKTERSELLWQTKQLSQQAEQFLQKRTQFNALYDRLQLLSPLGILSRGYAVAFLPDGRVLQDVNTASTGTLLTLRLANGTIKVKVT